MKRLPTAVALAAAAILTAPAAHAAGTAKLKSSEVQEVSGAWHVFVTIELAKPPLTAHVPMKFVFNHTVRYERTLTDQSPNDPVNTRQNLQNEPPSVESLDVDFSNSQGKIFTKTQFDFGLTRTRGYEAGEYDVQVRTNDGVDIGKPMHLILKGDNPVVDRRAMVFDPKKPNIKKIGDGSDGGTGAKGPDNAADYQPPSGDVTPSGTPPPFVDPNGFTPTEEEKIKEKPGGCGCSVPGFPAGTVPGALAFLGLGALAVTRRRRS